MMAGFCSMNSKTLDFKNLTRFLCQVINEDPKDVGE